MNLLGFVFRRNIADSMNNRIVRWFAGDSEGTTIIGKFLRLILKLNVFFV